MTLHIVWGREGTRVSGVDITGIASILYRYHPRPVHRPGGFEPRQGRVDGQHRGIFNEYMASLLVKSSAPNR